jgi:hypothetical protein
MVSSRDASKISDIPRPAADVSDSPDELTSGAIRQAAQRGKLTQKSLQIEATDRLIKHHEDACLELRAENYRLQEKLDDLAPKYAALEQAMRGVNASILVGTICMSIGGGVVGFAPFLDVDDGTRKLIAGVAMGAMVCGALFLLATFYSKWPIPRLRNRH